MISGLSVDDRDLCGAKSLQSILLASHPHLRLKRSGEVLITYLVAFSGFCMNLKSELLRQQSV